MAGQYTIPYVVEQRPTGERTSDVFSRLLSDRIIFLDDGHIVEEATPEAFFTHPKSERAKEFLENFEFVAKKRKNDAE